MPFSRKRHFEISSILNEKLSGSLKYLNAVLVIVLGLLTNLWVKSWEK